MEGRPGESSTGGNSGHERVAEWIDLPQPGDEEAEESQDIEHEKLYNGEQHRILRELRWRYVNGILEDLEVVDRAGRKVPSQAIMLGSMTKKTFTPEPYYHLRGYLEQHPEACTMDFQYRRRFQFDKWPEDEKPPYRTIFEEIETKRRLTTFRAEIVEFLSKIESASRELGQKQQSGWPEIAKTEYVLCLGMGLITKAPSPADVVEATVARYMMANQLRLALETMLGKRIGVVIQRPFSHESENEEEFQNQLFNHIPHVDHADVKITYVDPLLAHQNLGARAAVVSVIPDDDVFPTLRCLSGSLPIARGSPSLILHQTFEEYLDLNPSEDRQGVENLQKKYDSRQFTVKPMPLLNLSIYNKLPPGRKRD
ncbi:hypothetical protein BDV96DRAFT_639135 [Lophiotrema nucula]|uniref:Uncharacterized protein n=1 Tax=Lophiotrema nucula TaxID=690887 RepID=A0A6A5ZU07_9PLEO|nr:hypothetical protein BDV96DRAFT_639135 [Lophiotrema nucula]